MSAAPETAATEGIGKESATASSQVEPPPWESPQWKEAVSQNPGLAPFFDNLASFVELPEGVAKLREMILDLAVRGQLSEQDDNDEPASELLERIFEERKRLEKAKQLRKKKYPPPPNGDEVSHALPNGWAWTRLSIIGEIGPRNDVEDDVEVSFLPMKTIADGFTSSIEPEVRPWGEIKKGFTHIADGDIAIAKITPCFQNRKSAVMRGLLNGVGAGTTELHVVRPIGGGIVAEYALLHLKCLTFLNVGVSKMTGSAGQKRVPKEYFADTPFPLPPLAEQRRIVSKVESLMSLCDTLESQRWSRESVRERASRSVLARLTSASAPALATSMVTSPNTKRPAGQPETLASAWQRLSNHFEVLLDQPETVPHLRQSILQLAVQGKLVPQDPMDEPIIEFLSQIDATRERLLEEGVIRNTKTKDTVKQSLESVPIGWERRPLSDLCRFIDYRGKTPTRTTSGVRLITAKNVRMGSVENEPVEFVTEKQYHEWMTRGLPEPGDLLFVTEGHTMGFVGMLDLTFRFALAQRTINLRPYCDGFNEYLFNYLMSPQFQRDVFENATGSAAKGIKAAKLKQLYIAIPPKAEQKRIVSKVSVLLSQCDELSARLRGRQSTTDAFLTATIHQILEGSM